jgi:hypothetical protein
MLGRFWIIAVGAALLALAPGVNAASAAPVSVQLRVEGSSATTFEGAVTTDGKTIDKGTGPHACDGTNGGVNPTPGPTMTSALDDGSIAGGFTWDGTWFDGFSDFGIDRAGPDAGNSTQFWGYALNYVATQVGGCQQQVHTGDEVLFGFDFFSKAHLLKLDGPSKAAVGAPFQVRVTDGGSGAPIDGASVTGAAQTTGSDGSAALSFDSPGVRSVKAERADSLRSNALHVCVSSDGTGACGVSPSSPGAQATGGSITQATARDTKAPVARISAPADGARYESGPRVLRGMASDDASGVIVVKIALRRHVRGQNCRWWSGRREQFVGSHCHKVYFFGIGSDANWSYLLPRKLPPGRYVLDVKAFDRVRNRDEKFVRGQNRIVFEVLRRR